MNIINMFEHDPFRATPIFPDGATDDSWFKPQKAEDISTALPPLIIEGLWRQQEVLLLGGHAKSWKSWALMDLMFCIANGFGWLIWPDAKAGRVLVLDMELFPGEIRNRFESIRKSYSYGNLHNIDVISLRGIHFGMERFRRLSELIQSGLYQAISFDPTYRMLTGDGQSESDPAAITELMNCALEIGTTIKAGVGLLQHFSKGNQSNKRGLDAFSGTGIWGRAPDQCIAFREHEDERCYTVSSDLRHWENKEPFVVQFKHPRFMLCPGKDPDALKIERKSTGRPKAFTVEQLCMLIEADEYISYTSLLRRAEASNVLKRTFERRLKEAKEKQLVAINPSDSTYFLTVHYLAKFRQSE
jgi:RecA-family ATPase